MLGLHVLDEGAGPPVVCLHGIGSSSLAFDGLIQAARSSHRVLAWDAPGYGKSRDVSVPDGIDAYADAVAAVLDERAIGAAHVVGLSWGAAIGLRFVARHADRVRSLSLVSPTLGYATRVDRAEAVQARADELASIGVAEFANRRAARLLSPNASIAMVQSVRDLMRDAITPAGYQAAAVSLAGADLISELPTVRVPTLVVCGSDDGVTGIREGELVTEGVQGAVLVVIEDAGHLDLLERPEPVHSWILAHIEIAEGLCSLGGRNR